MIDDDRSGYLRKFKKISPPCFLMPSRLLTYGRQKSSPFCGDIDDLQD